MYVLIEPRSLVASGFTSSLARQGVPLACFHPKDFTGWVSSAASSDIATIEAFLFGGVEQEKQFARLIRQYSRAPVIALSEVASLERTIELFEAGADDVVRKPVHARELLARVEAIRRRGRPGPPAVMVGRLRVYFDGRPPEIDCNAFILPRRERRILELLVSHHGKWMTKQQIFHATYGLFDDKVQDNVVESHISKLRRKIVHALGIDLVESKRYLGYRIIQRPSGVDAIPAVSDLL